MRPIYRLLEKLRASKARKAGKALSARRVQKQRMTFQQRTEQLCGELGRPPIKLIRR